MMIPDIFFFNPTCESAIANGSPYYTPPARLRQFESDLGYLPAWLGEEKDLVLVQGEIDQVYIKKMRQLGFCLPEVVHLLQALSDDAWISSPKGWLRPWGRSPAMYHLFRNLIPNCNEAFRQSPVVNWKPKHKEMYSRMTALELLEKLLKVHQHDWLPDPSGLPVICHSLETVHQEIDRLIYPSPGSGIKSNIFSGSRQPLHKQLPYPQQLPLLQQLRLLRPFLQHDPDFPISPFSNIQISQSPNSPNSSKFSKAVVKMPWSSSGRGLLLFPNPDSAKKNDEVLSGMLRQQGFVTVEPWHDKIIDISYQFEASAGKIIYKGRTFLENDPKGRYVRNYLTEDIEIQQDVKLFLEAHESDVVAILEESLSQSNYATQYEGWIGVDAIIYRDENSVLKFHPMLEINGRFTMGAIALKMRNYLAEGSTGFLEIFYSKTGNFQSFCQKKELEKPLTMKDHKILSGFLPLTPPSPNHHFGAFVEVKPPLPNCS